MGTEALWVPLLLSAAGAGVSYYNNNQLQDRQDKVITSGLMQQKARQADVNKTTDELLSKFAASNPEADKAKANAAYMQALNGNRSMANAGLSKVAGASADYNQGSQDAALGVADYGQLLSGLMSRIEAPQDQRRREGVMLDDYGVNLDKTKRMSQGDAFINDLRLKSLHSNPWLSALSAGLQGAAGGVSAGAGGSDFLSSLLGKKVDFGIPLPGSGLLPAFR